MLLLPLSSQLRYFISLLKKLLRMRFVLAPKYLNDWYLLRNPDEIMANLKKHMIQMPEKILEDQTCTVCKKYLSYPPTKTYYTGEIKCGRCSEENDFGVVSSFDKVAANITFPCVNRYEGCTDLMEYRTVPEHEKECKGGRYACPICPIGKYGPESALHLLDHFKKQHKHNVINNLVIHINKAALSKQYYLHYNPQLNVMILIFLRIDGNVLSTNLSTVGDTPDLIQQQVKLFENYPETIISTSLWRACSSWNDNLEVFDISLNDELEGFSVEYLLKESVKCIRTTVSQLSSLEEPRELYEPALKNKPSRDTLSGIEAATGWLQSYSHPSLPDQERKFRNVNSSVKGTFPRFHLESVEDSYLKEKLKTPLFSSCGKYIVDETGEKLIDMRCSLCENYFPLIDDLNNLYKCLNCSFSVCTSCSFACCPDDEPYTCPVCFSDLDKMDEDLCYQLDYYCRFDCGERFRGSDFVKHDRNCNKSVILGEPSEFCNQVILAKHFGPNFFPWSELRKENEFSMSKIMFEDKPESVERLYVIDARGFEYIVDCKTWGTSEGVSFNIHHEYDPSKYFVTINIIENKTFRQLHDCCSLQLEFDDRTKFAIIFKERD